MATCILKSVHMSQPPLWQAFPGAAAGWSTFPLTPPSTHWLSSHIQNNPQAIIGLNKKNTNYLVGTAVPMNACCHGECGENRKEWNLHVYTKEWNHLEPLCPYLSFLSLCLAYWCFGGEWWFLQPTFCLVDNYWLARDSHYLYLNKSCPNCVRRDRSLAVHLQSGEGNFFSFLARVASVLIFYLMLLI